MNGNMTFTGNGRSITYGGGITGRIEFTDHLADRIELMTFDKGAQFVVDGNAFNGDGEVVTVIVAMDDSDMRQLRDFLNEKYGEDRSS